jgi:putative DNA primase/helicase
MDSENSKRDDSKSSQLYGVAMRFGIFLMQEFEVGKRLLGLMILVKSIGMLAGPRGGGKTWLALLITYSVAAGKQLNPWGNGGGARVVYLDGEMRAAGLQERLQLIHARNKNDESIAKVEKNLYIISRDCMGMTIGSIDTVDGQAAIDNLIPTGVKLIVIDNFSAWTTGGREDSSSWATTKNWLIEKRVQGIAVLLLHHTGKNGQQRGSSAHEDLLDYSIMLSPLPSSLERKDTRFTVEHTKLRDYIPELRQRYEYSIWAENDELNFECVPAGFALTAAVSEMARLQGEGLSCEAIGKRLGVSKSTVSRNLKKLRDQSGDDEEEVSA